MKTFNSIQYVNQLIEQGYSEEQAEICLEQKLIELGIIDK